jgi:LSD1 subclass zinc finger protein
MMARTLNCPGCGAALEYYGTASPLRCAYCNNLVEVLAELRLEVASVTANQRLKALTPAVKYLLVFVIIVTVIPACISLIGALIGIVAGVGAPILSIFLSFISR